jgi:putative peptidoglycan lipid II flippase
MAKRIISYKHTLINSAGTFFSRATGILKQNVVSYLFGAGADVFWAAFRIVNSLRRYIGEGGALGNSFIPVFQKKLSEGSREEAFKFASNIINVFLLINLLITVLATLLAPFYLPFLTPGYKRGSIELRQSIILAMIMMPYIIFICLYAIAMGILNSFKKFFSSAFAPFLFNIIFIIFPILLVKKFGIYTLGFAVILGVIFMFAAQLFELYGIGFKYRFYINFKDAGLKQFFRLFLPTSLNMLFFTGKNLTTTLFLTFFPGGLVIMMNSFTIIEAPLGFIGIAIGTVLMPLLSRFNAEKDFKNFETSFTEGFYMLFYFMIPVSFFFIFYPDTVVNSVLRDIMRFFTGNTGKYTPQLFKDTYLATSIYSISLLPMGCIVIFEKIYYSIHDAKTLLAASLIVFLLSFGLYFISFIPRIGLFGVIIADTIVSWVTLIYYYSKLQRRMGTRSVAGPLVFKILLLILFAFLSSAAIYPVHKYLYLPAKIPIIALLTGGLEFAVFTGIYYTLTILFGLRLKR